LKKAEVYLEYQPLVHEPPTPSGALFQQSCANDAATIAHWKDIWVNQIKANKERFGSFADNSVFQLFKKFEHGAAIIAGAGPSLKNNAHKLKNRGKIPLISCLHNFHFLEDLGCPADYYVSLDAGKVVVEEVTEGGSGLVEDYWAKTRDRTLLAFIGSDPELLAKWQGKILFFNAPLPDKETIDQIDAIEKFTHYVSCGGNVLGACLYISKAILGCFNVIFVGADFSFGYDHKFHAWDSKYDKDMGVTVKLHDIYGIPVKTWASYAGFKSYFEHVALDVPGGYYNCSEGGCLGAYPHGNLSCFKYLDLEDCLKWFNASDNLQTMCDNPNGDVKNILYS
jgi:hypothetical protein